MKLDSYPRMQTTGDAHPGWDVSESQVLCSRCMQINTLNIIFKSHLEECVMKSTQRGQLISNRTRWKYSTSTHVFSVTVYPVNSYDSLEAAPESLGALGKGHAGGGERLSQDTHCGQFWDRNSPNGVGLWREHANYQCHANYSKLQLLVISFKSNSISLPITAYEGNCLLREVSFWVTSVLLMHTCILF